MEELEWKSTTEPPECLLGALSQELHQALWVRIILWPQ